MMDECTRCRRSRSAHIAWLSTVTRLPTVSAQPRRWCVAVFTPEAVRAALSTGVVKISGALIEGASARFDTHIGAGETRVLPIDLADALSAARPKQRGKAAS